MIKGILADCIVSAYLLGTLFLRFMAEDALSKHPILSISLGVVMLLFLWALLKVKFIKPNYFGLLDSKRSTTNEEDDSTLFV